MITQLLFSVAYRIPANWRNALPHRLQRLIKVLLQHLQLTQWCSHGCPPPPPHIIKVSTILSLKSLHNIDTFIETGTYMGDMLDSVKHSFNQLYSIELQVNFYKRAKQVFKHDTHIHLIQGDSGVELSKILKKLRRRSLFWLDAHYSGGETARASIDTPIERELQSIFRHRIKNHVILVDDARLFNGKNGYPTMKRLRAFCKKQASSYTVSVHNDCIHILPEPNS